MKYSEVNSGEVKFLDGEWYHGLTDDERAEANDWVARNWPGVDPLKVAVIILDGGWDLLIAFPDDLDTSVTLNGPLKLDAHAPVYADPLGNAPPWLQFGRLTNRDASEHEMEWRDKALRDDRGYIARYCV